MLFVLLLLVLLLSSLLWWQDFRTTLYLYFCQQCFFQTRTDMFYFISIWIKNQWVRFFLNQFGKSSWNFWHSILWNRIKKQNQQNKKSFQIYYFFFFYTVYQFVQVIRADSILTPKQMKRCHLPYSNFTSNLFFGFVSRTKKEKVISLIIKTNY